MRLQAYSAITSLGNINTCQHVVGAVKICTATRMTWQNRFYLCLILSSLVDFAFNCRNELAKLRLLLTHSLFAGLSLSLYLFASLDSNRHDTVKYFKLLKYFNSSPVLELPSGSLRPLKINEGHDGTLFLVDLYRSFVVLFACPAVVRQKTNI